MSFFNSWNEPYPSSLTNLVMLEGVVLQYDASSSIFTYGNSSILAITAIAMAVKTFRLPA
ncbi:Uncharacterised protein [Klebsiella pneumoniae]|nr:Uncharacterised protein [Klebsiella pneumoniae]